jgi:phosphatidylserine decarboxylase
MGIYLMLLFLLSPLPLIGAFYYWRYIWFFRNPRRNIPEGGCIVSPADGTVVYIKIVKPERPVIVIKKGVRASINDIASEDLKLRKIIIGIFMSPFDVHYNRAPMTGVIKSVRHYPAKNNNISMWQMHLRTLLNRKPYYKDSLHILQNERTITRLEGQYREAPLSCYVIQIAGWSVNGIDSYVTAEQPIEKGEIFGMIRIGSQVDIVLPHRDNMQIKVNPGDKVRAGETVIIE